MMCEVARLMCLRSNTQPSTRSNAKVVGLEGQVGTIEKGRLADIILWDRDPVADIKVLQQPELLSLVIKDGRVIDRGRLGYRDLERCRSSPFCFDYRSAPPISRLPSIERGRNG